MILLLLLSLLAPQREQIADDLYIREIEAGVYVVTHEFPWPANSLVVEMDDGTLVLVDTPYTANATTELLVWLDDHFGQRDMVAINSGFHVDNLGGNAALIARDIPVYGSSETVDLLDERGEDSRERTLGWLQSDQDTVYREGHAATPYVGPTHPFELEDGLELTFGEQTVQIVFPGAAHKPDNVAVYFPDRGLLFGGCMVLAEPGLGNTSDASLDEWADSIRTLEGFEAEIIIPGHGDRTDADLLAHTIELVEAAN